MKAMFIDKQNSTSGIAMVEIAIVLPFLVLLTMGFVDISFALKDYMILAEAAKEGVREAVGTTNLTGKQEFCESSKLAKTLTQTTPAANSLERRIVNLKNLHNLDLQEFCISYEPAPDSAVKVTVGGNFDGFFSFLGQVKLEASAVGPKIFN